MPPSDESVPVIEESTRWFVDEVQTHEAKLRSFLRGMFPSVRDVDDIVQESYLRVWRRQGACPIDSVNRLRTGEIATGGTTRLERPDDSTARGPTAKNARSTTEIVPIDGKSLYTLYCVACHQPDGRGVAGGAADFVNNKAHLTKPDAELLKVIADGIEAKGMPPFKTLLSGDQQRAVLVFLRHAFGGAREPVTPRSQ